MKTSLINFRKAGLILSIPLLFVLFFGQNILQVLDEQIFTTNTALAGDTCKIEVSVIFRDQDNNFVPDLNYGIYTQVDDADGEVKPGVAKASGKTNTNTGIGYSTFTYDSDDDPHFAVKA